MEKYRIYACGALFFWVSLVGSVHAASCDIVTPVDFYSPGSPETEERYTIEGCTNPFGETEHIGSSVTSRINGDTVTTGDELVFDTLPVTLSYEHELSGIPPSMQVGTTLYHQTGDDYYLVPLELPNMTFQATGTYVLVTNTYEIPVMVRGATWWRTLTNFLLPTVALAQVPSFGEVYVTTFTVSLNAPLPPTGASSVLFLPGIQASRLYTDGALGSENQLWEPNRDADVEKLAMTEAGVSVNNIYTKEVIDEVNVLPVGQGNIYKGFLSLLDEMVKAKEIASSTAFAYDWRYDVFSVATSGILYPNNEVKHLLDEVLRLAESSYTKKVTIIGHSNGGLLAKALLSTYGEAELAGKVDKVVLIGTPQLGTPKAIGSMLHGLDQSLGLGAIATADTVRQVTKNMPGAYTLLPAAEYFDETNEPIITTDGSALAKTVTDYGEINSAGALDNFLLNSLGNRTEAVGLNEPITLNASISAEARNSQEVLTAWRAPDGVSVYEVAGTGLATIKGYQYREYGCADTNAFCVLNSYLKPFPIMTNEGDETVVEHSAVGYGGDKMVAKVNLYDAAFLKPNTHADLMENNQVQDFLESVIKYPYLIEAVTVPEFTDVSSRYRIIAVHSPVSILATDQAKKQVGLVAGEIKEEIPNSQYFELGESKYIVLPSEADVSVVVQGTGEGVYSLSVDEVDEVGKQRQTSLLARASSSPTMTAKFSIENDTYSSIKTDLNGDGKIDVEQTLAGAVIVTFSNDYRGLSLAIKSLGLKKKFENELLVKVMLAEIFSKKARKGNLFGLLERKTLQLIMKDINQYYRSGLISESNLNLIKEIVSNLNE